MSINHNFSKQDLEAAKLYEVLREVAIKKNISLDPQLEPKNSMTNLDYKKINRNSNKSITERAGKKKNITSSDLNQYLQIN